MGYDEILVAIELLSPEELEELNELRMKRGIVTAEEIVEAFKQLSPEDQETLLRKQDARERVKLWIKLLRQNGSSNA